MKKLFSFYVFSLFSVIVSASPGPKSFTVTIHPGQKINFEFFLDNFYETVITINKNNAQVYTANVDSKPTGSFDGGTNTSSFDVVWSFTIQSKCSRSGHFRWAQDDLQKKTDYGHGNIQLVSTTPGNQACPARQNSVVNVAIR